MRRTLLACLIFLLLSAAAWAQAPLPDSSEIEQKVNAIVGKMTLEQKIDLLGGINVFDVRGYPEFGLPLLHTADGPVGVRNDGPATTMAGGISLASTWDAALAQRVGEQIGRDARAKGKHFVLGPGVNIYRSPLNGRNFEYFGEDPFLGARIAVGYINGMQSQGVSATVKHFMGNNSEFDRHGIDSIIDERTMREIYLPVFEAAVKEAQVGAVMDSYNFVNGEHMTQNGRMNIDLLKKEWGFKGVLMSDWDATYDGVAAANGGMDLEMPYAKFMNRETLLPAVKAGKVSEETINDKVRRIIRTELQFGWTERPQQELSVPRYSREGREVALQAAREGMVLLKNEGNVLPLKKEQMKTVALIGPNAYPAIPVGGGSAQVAPFHAVSFVEGVSNYLGEGHNVLYAPGVVSLGRKAIATEFRTEASGGKPGLKYEEFDNDKLAGSPKVNAARMGVKMGDPFDLSTIKLDELDVFNLPSGKNASQRWSGYYIAKSAGTYDIFVQQGGFDPSGFRMYVDDKLLFDQWDSEKFITAQQSVSLSEGPHKVVVEHHGGGGLQAPYIRMGIVPQSEWVEDSAEEIASKADAVIVAVGYDPTTETEGWDRTFQLPPGQNELIERIAAKNKNTIVVITSGGGVDMAPWIDKVAGVIEAWYPGQEGGTALAEILFGEVNPSGHLAATFERKWEENPSYGSYYEEKGSNRDVYKEGIFVGYRGYEHNNVKPLFPFGFGLSYTNFKYANLQADEQGVSFEVTNAGLRAGDCVPQVYLAPEHSSVPWPPKELKGFARVSLKPRETKTVKIPFNTRSFAYYDVSGKRWRAEKGDYDVQVGSSSERIELKGKLTVAQERTEQ